MVKSGLAPDFSYVAVIIRKSDTLLANANSWAQYEMSRGHIKGECRCSHYT